MSALGRISGPLLKSNLIRNGIDLAFETDLLYLDVNNQRIGIKSAAPQYELDVNGTTRTTNLIVTNRADIGNINIVGNTISSDSPTLNIGTEDDVVYNNRLTIDSISIDGNAISTNTSNANLELRPNGTGLVQIGDIGWDPDTERLRIYGSMYLTGNITIDGNIQIGDSTTDQITFNAEIASDLIPSQNAVYNLGSNPATGGNEWADAYINNLVSTTITSADLDVDGIDLVLRQGNIVYVAENGSDTASGTHPQDPAASLKYALDNLVNPGDTVYIYPGVYEEEFPLTVPTGVSIRGQGIRSVKIVPTVATQDKDAFLLNGESTIEDITVADFYYNSSNDTGYAFRFAPGFTVTSRSPYIKNISVITAGSTTTVEDPRGFNAGDAGRGAYIDGSVATTSSKEASMLFHSATFITPGVDAITATNGARIEWLNSFTYFANRSIYAFDSADGLYSDGKTRIRLSGLSGTAPAAGQTVTFTSTDSSTVVGPLNIESVEDSNILIIDGKNTDLFGFDRTPESIVFSGTGTATTIENVDVRDFGAEIRLIGSASVYGNFGLVGDGEGVLMYAIGHNLAYIGNGKEVTNDPTTVIQANEVVEANGAQIRYNSVDHKGDFRVGDLFYVNQETGTVDFSVSDFTINTTNGVTFTTGGNTTFIDGTKVETGDWRISGNTVQTLTQDANFTAGSGEINLNGNVNVGGNLDVTGNVTVGGNITIGDEATDTIQILAGIESDLIPRNDSAFSLGTSAKRWTTLYTNEVNVDGIRIRDNFIETVDSNSDLELRASGTGSVLIPNNDVQVDGNVTVGGSTTLQNTNITGSIVHVGDATQTGNYEITGSFSNGDIQIDGNVIETTTSNSDLELRANGTGKILIPNNDVEITNDVIVSGTTNLSDTVINGTVTQVGNFNQSGNFTIAGKISTSNIDIETNFISTSDSNSDLELRANGTGEVLIPNNNLQIDNNLTVSGTTNLDNTTINGNFVHNGSFSGGNMDVTGNVTVSQNLTVGASAQFEEILIDDNFITTTTSNTDLELRANGTGNIIVPNNDVNITNDLTVAGDISANNLTATANITTNDANIGDIQISGTTVEATASNADLELRANGTGEILVPSNDVVLSQDLTVQGSTSLQGTAITGTLTHIGDTTQTGNVTLTGNWTNGDIQVSNNIIQTTLSNSDLDLRANGTGIVKVENNSVTLGQELTVQGSTDLQNTTVTGTITHTGDTTQTGNYTIAGTFSNGDIQVSGNTIETTTSNSNLDLRANGSGIISVPTNNVEITNNLDVDGITNLDVTNIDDTLTHVGDTTQTGNYTITGQFSNGDILINDNTIETTATNSDLELRANGTGIISVPNNSVTFSQALTVSGDTDLQGTTITGTIIHVGDTTQTGNFAIAGEISNGDILVKDNFIATTVSNSNLELRANGAGIISIPTNNVEITNNLTVDGDTNLDDTTINGTITHVGDTTQTGNYTITGAFSNGDIQIDGNTIETTASNSDLELRASGSGTITVPSNDVTFSQALTVGGATDLQNTTITGTVTQVGDYTQTGNFTIGGEISNGNILIEDNFIATTNSNSDLELRANGTGKVLIPSNDLEVNNDLTVNGNTTLGFTEISGDTVITGDITQTGDYSITDDVNVGGTLTVGTTAQFEEILIDDNFITTTTSNTDLELRASGTGEVYIPNNNLRVANNANITGSITANDLTVTGTITSDIFTTGDIVIDDNFITTTNSNSNLELRTAGTGNIYVPNNDVVIDSTLTVNGNTNLQSVAVTGSITQTGNVTQTGNIDITGNLNVDGNITISSASQFEDIKISGNVIETTQTNSDLELRANGTGEVLIPNNDVSITGSLVVDGTLNVDNINATGKIVANSFSTGDILIDDNFITTTNSNSDLELRGNGTGSIIIDSLEFKDSEIISSSDITLTPGSGTVLIDSTGSLQLPVGDTSQRPAPQTGQIRYNDQLNRFEGFNGTNWINLVGVEDLDGNTKVTAELTEGANDNTIRFDVNGSTVVDINSNRLNAHAIVVDDIRVDGNVISTITANTDLVLTANGTGSVTFENFAIRDNTITNTVSNSVTTFEGTDDGYVKFDGTYGLVIPSGGNTQRPPLAYTELGQMRFNTDASRVEIYDGANWVSVAGSSSGITRADAEDIAFEIVLSLG